jgi:cyclopropane fatty-acyl-phospholipid synthase-like methyltransferase
VTDEMIRYYAKRAGEYDRVYDLPQWQRDLTELKRRVPGVFAGHRVFEVACGTGYWTRWAARQAVSVFATDLNEEPLAIARSRTVAGGHVGFHRLDAYAPNRGGPTFDAGFAAFWLSHVDMSRMREFLDAFHSYLTASSPVLMFDERPTAGRPHPMSRTDDTGNRYEWRELARGGRFEIIKNFFDRPLTRHIFAGYGCDFTYEELEHFWLLSYRTIPRAGAGEGPRG